MSKPPTSSASHDHEIASPFPSSRPRRGQDIDARVLWCAARWIEDRLGARELDKICQAAGLSPGDISRTRSHFIAMEQLQDFLQELRDRVSTDDEFCAAIVHRFGELHKHMRWLLWAMTPTRVVEAAMRTLPVIAPAARAEIAHAGPTLVVTRIHWKARPTRLQCLSSSIHTAHLPTFWGLPAAVVEHPVCQAEGADCCEHRFTFQQLPRSRGWLAALAGAASGGLVVFALGGSRLELALGAATVGLTLGLVRAHRARVEAERAQHDLAEQFRQAGGDFAENRTEVLSMLERQDDWLRDVTAETVELRQRLEDLRGGAADPSGSEEGLDGALTSLVDSIAAVKSRAPVDAEGSLTALERAAESMLRHLSAPISPIGRPSATVRISVPALVERLRRRAHALARFAGGAKASVLLEHDAPSSIEIDTAVFDRVLDMLIRHVTTKAGLSNVVITVSSDASHLSVKFADESEVSNEQEEGRLLTEGRALARWLGGNLAAQQYSTGTTYWLRVPERPPAGARVRHLFALPTGRRDTRKRGE
jgi:hypothetical protein